MHRQEHWCPPPRDSDTLQSEVRDQNGHVLSMFLTCRSLCQMQGSCHHVIIIICCNEDEVYLSSTCLYR